MSKPIKAAEGIEGKAEPAKLDVAVMKARLLRRMARRVENSAMGLP